MCTFPAVSLCHLYTVFILYLYLFFHPLKYVHFFTFFYFFFVRYLLFPLFFTMFFLVFVKYAQIILSKTVIL
ncbi:hypothetical protein DW886_28460 [Enterocloster aldenensis]|nr:hypothetical protein DW886_28460 [Enterocloster aldenensis]